MRARYAALVTALVLVATSAAAMAAVTPRHPASFFYVKVGTVSITLDTNAAKQIAAGKPNPAAKLPVSGIIVVCSARGPGGSFVELHIAFPGAKLKPAKGHYGFTSLYTDSHARRAVVGAHNFTLLRAKVKVNGTVSSAKLITGTISVSANGCDLKPTNYKAKFFRALPR
jgi:hypothetical protein